MAFKMTFRWYGENDAITLDAIRQIPCMTGVVTAVYDTPVGEVWSNESINRLKSLANAKGLEFEVVESVPVHEEIKLGGPDAARLIDNYKENVRRLGNAGVRCICYNFMPVFDWLRSDLAKQLPDGSNALAYDRDTVLSLDPLKSELSLPGWDESYTKDGLKELLGRYKDVDEEKLWGNFATFLKEVIPVAPQRGHPRRRGVRREDGDPPRRPAVGHLRTAAHHHRQRELQAHVLHRRQPVQRHHFLHRFAGRRPRQQAARDDRRVQGQDRVCASAQRQDHRRALL